MIVKIKRYGISVQRDRLSVWSNWEHGTYKMTFKITRWNPLTYIKPLFWMVVRKLNPAYYFKKFPNQTWHICHICGAVGNKDIEGLNVCEGCKLRYDD